MTQVERFNRTTALMYHQRGDTRCKRIRFATFKDVERHYNNIKPVVSKYHKKEDDIRPINRRDRKWERIEKRNSLNTQSGKNVHLSCGKRKKCQRERGN